jgi:hypothetical protein
LHLLIGRLALLPALLAPAFGVHALSLGDLSVRSTIGQSFEAVIAYHASADDAVGPHCVRINAPGAAAESDLPQLPGVRATLRERPGGGQIVLGTRTLVNEPAFRLRVTIDCGPRAYLSREFVVLLDAPGTAQPPVDAQPAPAIAAQAIPSTPQELQPRRARREASRAAAAAPMPSAPGPATTAPRAASAGLPSLRIDAASARGPGGVSRATRAARATQGQGRGGFRLTLSKPDLDVADLPANLHLKRSDELASLTAPARSYAQNEMEELRAAARLALADDPLAEAARLQTRLGAIEANVVSLKRQLGDLEAQRRTAEERAARLAEENRRLETRQGTLLLIIGLAFCALLVAWVMRRYRLSAERRGRAARLEWPDPAADVAPTQRQAAPPAPPARPVTATGSHTVMGASASGTPDTGPAREGGSPPSDSPQSPEVTAVEYQRTMVLDLPVKAPARSATAPASSSEAGPANSRPPARAPKIEPEYLPESALIAPGEAATPDPGARIPTIKEKTLDAPAFDRMPPPAASTGAIDFVLGNEASESTDRATRYLAEFERKLFPEVALGRVKLDDPRSIIALARTYYQEDFDPAKAISFLEYTLHRSTDPMRIHLALLEVLRLERRVGEYATVARAFRGQYPDSGTHWQLVAAYGRLLDSKEPMYDGDRVPGLDLDTPSNWLGSTLDMTKYVLGQKVADALRDTPAPATEARP